MALTAARRLESAAWGSAELAPVALLQAAPASSHPMEAQSKLHNCYYIQNTCYYHVTVIHTTNYMHHITYTQTYKHTNSITHIHTHPHTYTQNIYTHTHIHTLLQVTLEGGKVFRCRTLESAATVTDYRPVVLCLYSAGRTPFFKVCREARKSIGWALR